MSFRTYIDEQYDNLTDKDILTLDEKMYYEWKTREGKRVKKWHTDRKNYRIQINKKTGQPKEVYITPSERLKRKIGQRKAAIKRRAKQRNITAKRLKSFHVRRNFGDKYNTNSHSIKKIHKHHGNIDSYLENDNLYPNMLESQILLETPWVEVLPDLIWDFYSEVNPGQWLLQLVSLITDHVMVSLNLTTSSNNAEYENKIQITDQQLDHIIDVLLHDMLFLRMAKYAYHNDMSEEDAILFDTVVGSNYPELLDKIKGLPSETL